MKRNSRKEPRRTQNNVSNSFLLQCLGNWASKLLANDLKEISEQPPAFRNRSTGCPPSEMVEDVLRERG